MNFASFLSLLLSASLHEGCVVDVKKLKPEPIVLNANYEFIYPNGANIDAGGKIIVSCPGTHFVDFPETSIISLVCNEKDDFELEGVALAINTSLLNCNKDIVSSVQYTNRTCWENAETIRMGYQVDSVFVSVMDVCFDAELKNALYSNYSVTKSLDDASLVDMIQVMGNVTQDGVFDSLFYSIEYIYNNGRGTLNSLVGLAYESNYYYDWPNMDRTPLGGYFCDLYYLTQIQAVSRFINMWPRLIYLDEYGEDLYNWYMMMLLMCENYFARSLLDLQVYTGTFGVVTLAHVFTGEKIPIYLYDHDVKAIPLPAVIWKLLYHEETKRAVVLLGVNGPYNDDYVICDDILSSLPWIHDYVGTVYLDPSRGQTYACSYPTLNEVIPYLPELDVVDILV